MSDDSIDKVLDYCLNGELNLQVLLNDGNVIWKRISEIGLCQKVKEYIKQNKLNGYVSSNDILKNNVIVEIVGMRPPNKKISEIVYVVRARGHVGYLNVSSSELQKSYPNLLIDFLESHIDFGPES